MKIGKCIYNSQTVVRVVLKGEQKGISDELEMEYDDCGLIRKLVDHMKKNNISPTGYGRCGPGHVELFLNIFDAQKIQSWADNLNGGGDEGIRV